MVLKTAKNNQIFQLKITSGQLAGKSEYINNENHNKIILILKVAWENTHGSLLFTIFLLLQNILSY